jgi:hypothetical protein
MIGEVVIHLGQEWRDLGFALFGMVCGAGLGWLYGWDYGVRQKKKK